MRATHALQRFVTDSLLSSSHTHTHAHTQALRFVRWRCSPPHHALCFLPPSAPRSSPSLPSPPFCPPFSPPRAHHSASACLVGTSSPLPRRQHSSCPCRAHHKRQAVLLPSLSYLSAPPFRRIRSHSPLPPSLSLHSLSTLSPSSPPFASFACPAISISPGNRLSLCSSHTCLSLPCRLPSSPSPSNPLLSNDPGGAFVFVGAAG